jgi:hypothetical protein
MHLLILIYLRFICLYFIYLFTTIYLRGIMMMADADDDAFIYLFTHLFMLFNLFYLFIYAFTAYYLIYIIYDAFIYLLT